MLLQSRRLVSLAVIASCLVAGPLSAAPPKKKPVPAAEPDAPAATPAAPAQAAPAAPAADAQQPAAAKMDLVGAQPEWTKICDKDPGSAKDFCFVTRDFSSAANQPPVLGFAVYDFKGEENKLIRMLMPVGLLLRPGFRLAVDKGPTSDGGFEVCIPTGCFGQVPVKAATTDAMKKAAFLTVSVRKANGQQVDFVVPMTGFGKASDGPAIDPKVLQEQQAKMQAELQRRADDERKKIEAQKASASPTGGASVAPAVGDAPK